MNFSMSDQLALLKSSAEMALKEIKDRGCDAGKVVFSGSKEFRIVIEDGDFSLANNVDSMKLGISVFKDHCKGTASSNLIDQQSIIDTVNAAKNLASFSVPDESLCLASLEEAPHAPAMDFLYDDELATIDMQKIETCLQDALEILESDERIELERMELSVGVCLHVLANTNGVLQHELQSSIEWDLGGMAIDGEQVGGVDYDCGFSFSAHDFESKLIEDITRFKDRLLSSLNPKACKPYKGKVILAPCAFDSLILDVLIYHMDGSQIMDGKSNFADSIGKQICSTGFNLVDNPRNNLMTGSTAYDSDGIPTKQQTLVDDGVLVQHLWDCYSAKRMGKTSNGFSGGPFSMEVANGKLPLKELSSTDEPILYVSRFSGNVDYLTGDFSGVAKNSSLFHKGEHLHPVTETMIAGNAFDLCKNILGFSKEVIVEGGDLVAPYTLVDGLTISS